MSLDTIRMGMKSNVTIFIAPAFGVKPFDFPCFRDCFIGDPKHPDTKDKLIVYTRTGGSNREAYKNDFDQFQSLDNFLFDYDDSLNNTYMHFVYEVLPEWSNDFKHMMDGNYYLVSQAYRQLCVDNAPEPEYKTQIVVAFDIVTKENAT